MRDFLTFEQEQTSSPQMDAPTVGCCGALPQLRWREDEAAHLAGMLKALAHPVRLQIVDLLNRFGGQVCVCDVEAQFDLSQPTISHHLKVLRQAGLIASEQRGVWIYYYTRRAALAQVQAILAGLDGGPEKTA
jgi:ArsR family transcriptional regulator